MARRRLLGLASGIFALGVASSSLAQSPTSPSFTRRWQGTAITPSRVSCGTSSTTLVTTGNALSVTLRNEGTSTVYVCASSPCLSSVAFGYLKQDDALTLDAAARARTFYCIASGAASVVYVLVEAP